MGELPLLVEAIDILEAVGDRLLEHSDGFLQVSPALNFALTRLSLVEDLFTRSAFTA